jgi:hypothetical protein
LRLEQTILIGILKRDSIKNRRGNSQKNVNLELNPKNKTKKVVYSSL